MLSGYLPELYMGLSSLPIRGRLVARLGEGAFLGLYSVIALAIFIPLVRTFFAHKHAGRWLKEHLQPEDCLIDPFEWAGCYSEKTLHHVFPDPDPEKRGLLVAPARLILEI